MKLIIDNLENKDIDASYYSSNLTYSTSLSDIFSTLKFDLPYNFYEDNNIKVFSRVVASSGSNFKFVGIVINTGLDNIERVSLTVVSESWYTSTYEEIVKVKNFRADAVIKEILSRYDKDFKVNSIPLQNLITKIYNGESIIGIIDDVIKQSEGAIGKKIYRTFENEVLKIFTEPEPYKLDLTYAISNLRLSYNGEDIKTQIKIYTEEKKSISIVSIKKNIELAKKAGVIQKVESIKAKDKGQADLIAENLLKIYGQIKRTGTFTIFGDYKARVGMSVRLEDNDYIISGLAHTIEDSIHLMNVSVIAYDKGA